MNLDALLAPISDTSPCGDDLSFSAEFDAIREMRRADDPSLDQGEWVTALKAADWPGVLSGCERLLATRKLLDEAFLVRDPPTTAPRYGSGMSGNPEPQVRLKCGILAVSRGRS